MILFSLALIAKMKNPVNAFFLALGVLIALLFCETFITGYLLAITPCLAFYLLALVQSKTIAPKNIKVNSKPEDLPSDIL